MPAKIHISAGERYGSFTILEESNPHIQPSGKTKRQFLCLCDCGVKKTVRLDALRSSNTVSCGCHKAKINKGRSKTHGMSYTPEYIARIKLIRRCTNPKHRLYPHYGGRGIKVCKRWLNSFEAFYQDMGPRPSADHSIDRIDNNGDYTPENCRWATEREQHNNKRSNRRITYKGRTQTLMQWARELDINYRTLRSRLARDWSIERAFTTPVHSNQ